MLYAWTRLLIYYTYGHVSGTIESPLKTNYGMVWCTNYKSYTYTSAPINPWIGDDKLNEPGY